MGMDQRKVNVLVRDYCDITKRNKPVILSHNMLPGPQQGQDKMLKNDPSTCIFMDDTLPARKHFENDKDAIELHKQFKACKIPK
ncbi:unnamed protein product [Trifolium pratense]|uniref:Uncharacterized protein n=1 Tax=Trifolium pratense TaxID=57577 RepID=A0ACB0LYQ0_TRIPR|nr:unnamed protein product [Trifolium pratense]